MPRLKLLWVTPYLPRRGIAACRERWWALLRRLAPRHDVTLVAWVDPEDAGADDGLPPELAVHRVPRTAYIPDDPMALLPRTVAGRYADPALGAAIAARLAAERFDLVQYEFGELAHLIPPSPVPSILTIHQVSFAQEGPLWRAEGRPLGRGAVLLHRYLRELDFDLRAVRRAHHVVTLTPEDAARLRRFHPDLAPSLSPQGIDCDEFRPPASPPPVEADVLFIGNFDHPPNADAVRFLVEDVVPRAGRPIRVRIAGRAIPPAIAALARPGVEIAGALPDVRPALAAAAVVVAPVRFGTGMRGKVLEALGMGRPVVATTLGAEGLGAVAGRHLLVADDAAAFAAALRGLLDDPARAARIGAAGRQLVESRFDWDAIAAGHDEIYERVLGSPGPPPRVPDPAVARSERLARIARHLGRRGAIAAGAAVLAARGLGWHLGRARARRALSPAALRARTRAAL
jgi:glycosyltransferase involved in cell wall biosynthesis